MRLEESLAALPRLVLLARGGERQDRECLTLFDEVATGVSSFELRQQCQGALRLLVQRLRRDLRFGIVVFGIALYDVFCALLYLSDSVAEGAFWQRLQLSVLGFLIPTFVYFIDAYAEVPGPKPVRRLSWAYTVLGLVALLERRGWVLTGVPAIKEVDVWGLGHVVYYEEATGPLYLLISTGILYVSGYTLAAALAVRRQGRRRRSNELLLGVSVFLAAVANDYLMAAGYIHSIYLFEHGFTAVLILVSFTLSAEVAEAARAKQALAEREVALSHAQLEVKPIDVGGGLRTLAPLMRHLLPASVRLDIEVIDHPPPVEADSSQLDQVWMNLTANARDAMPGGGKLSFSVAPDHANGGGVSVKVRDTGMGMSAATAAHIFEPFYTTKARGKGTGLGLSIVRGIVEQHGGRIGLDSEPGKGTTFWLWFPASSRPIVPEITWAAGSEIARGHGNLLVVDDDESIRTLAAEVLSAQGYQVRVAGSEAEVQQAISEMGTLDLLISDVILPDTDGPRIRQLVAARFPATPCLFMTGHADELLAPRGMLRDDIDLLRKPFTGERMLAKVDVVLQRERGRTVA
jgi:CheY-like chemotaxis protein